MLYVVQFLSVSPLIRVPDAGVHTHYSLGSIESPMQAGATRDPPQYQEQRT